jgi:peptidyl-prolyl cis-trans isomerase A (cyclophilin A)
MNRYALLLLTSVFGLACSRADDTSTQRMATGATGVGPSVARDTILPPRPAFVASPALLHPDAATLTGRAPDSFHIVFETSQGTMKVLVQRAWAPLGVDRLYLLTRLGFFTGMRFYKVQRDFIAQFGYTGDPRVTAVWDTLTLADEPASQTHEAGTLAFASNGPNTRTTQLFFNVRNNAGLELDGLTVVGKVIEGLDVLPRLYDAHGQGLGIDRIIAEGDGYLDRFTKLDFIVRATIVQ